MFNRVPARRQHRRRGRPDSVASKPAGSPAAFYAGGPPSLHLELRFALCFEVQNPHVFPAWCYSPIVTISGHFSMILLIFQGTPDIALGVPLFKDVAFIIQ